MDIKEVIVLFVMVITILAVVKFMANTIIKFIVIASVIAISVLAYTNIEKIKSETKAKIQTEILNNIYK